MMRGVAVGGGFLCSYCGREASARRQCSLVRGFNLVDRVFDRGDQVWIEARSISCSARFNSPIRILRWSVTAALRSASAWRTVGISLINSITFAGLSDGRAIFVPKRISAPLWPAAVLIARAEISSRSIATDGILPALARNPKQPRVALRRRRPVKVDRGPARASIPADRAPDDLRLLQHGQSVGEFVGEVEQRLVADLPPMHSPRGRRDSGAGVERTSLAGREPRSQRPPQPFAIRAKLGQPLRDTR
jgi:hypothetical protein